MGDGRQVVRISGRKSSGACLGKEGQKYNPFGRGGVVKADNAQRCIYSMIYRSKGS